MQSANVLGYTSTTASSAGGTAQPTNKTANPVEKVNGSSQRSFVQPLIVDETKQYMEGLVADDDTDSHKDENDGNTTGKIKKKTRGRVKIKMEFIQNKLRRYTTFSKRKTGIMKKVCCHF